MEDALRARLERLNTLSSHALRTAEHTIYDRVLYKNRSQHRGAPYFRRLEHVRRLLRRVREHPAWRAVDFALGQKRAKAPLSLSTVTLADLEDLAGVLATITAAAIPTAAVRLTVELIAREHFVPFSITVVAMLARLFMVESTVLAAVRGAVSDMRVLMAVDVSKLGSSVVACVAGGKYEEEDVGEALPMDDVVTERVPVQPSLPQIGAEAVPDGVPSTLKVTASGFKAAAIQIVQAPFTTTGNNSLYDLMAEHDPEVAALAESKVRASTATLQPPDPFACFATTPNATTDEPRTIALKLPNTEKDAPGSKKPVPLTPQEEGPSRKSIVHAALAAKTLTGADKVASSGSESDDMDDIFGVLSD